MKEISNNEECEEVSHFNPNDFINYNPQIPLEFFFPGQSGFVYPPQQNQNYFQDDNVNFSFERDKEEIINENEDDEKNNVSKILSESYFDFDNKGFPKENDNKFYDGISNNVSFSEISQNRTINNEFHSLFKCLFEDEDIPKKFDKNLIFIENKVIPNIQKPEEKKEENNFEQSQNHEIHDDNEIKIESPQKSINSKQLNKNSNISGSTGDSTPKNDPNMTVLNLNKYPFAIIHPPENFISTNMKLNMSSGNLYFKLKKKRIRNEVKKIKNIKNSEEIEKPLLREFKKYLKKNKDKKEFKKIFDKDKNFWKQFFIKSQPFKFTQNGKELVFKSFNRSLMEFIFSRDDVNKLYEKFASDKSYHIQKKIKEKDKNQDNNTYEIYLKNFNKKYNKKYEEKDLELDGFS